jgi:hypothetical protein
MSKAIINKHVDNSELINRNSFVEKDEKSKGEIIICNDVLDPSIYIINNEGQVTKISGGKYDDTNIYREVQKNADAINKNRISISDLEKTIGGVGDGDSIIEVIEKIKNSIGNIDENSNIIEIINNTKALIDNYTVNGKQISTNPDLLSSDLAIDNSYSSLSQSSTTITIGDNLTDAIGKLDNMVNKINLVLASSVNDLVYEIKELQNRIARLESIVNSGENDEVAAFDVNINGSNTFDLDVIKEVTSGGTMNFTLNETTINSGDY